MKNKVAIWLGAAAFVWYGFLRGVKAAKVTFDKLRVLEISGNSMLCEVAVFVHNPTLLDLTIERIAGTIDMMGIPVAVIDWNVAQRVRSFATSVFVLQFEAFSDKIGAAVWENIQSGDIHALNVTFDGSVTIKGVQIPIVKTFMYDDIVRSNEG